jgi:hypothetical protein
MPKRNKNPALVSVMVILPLPLRKTGHLPLRKTGGEENHHPQESQKQESQTKKTSAFSPANVVPNEAQAGRQSLPNAFSCEDDEKLLNPPPDQSAWSHLLKAFQAANRGAEMSGQDECWLREEMQRRHATPEALAELVRKNALTGFRNPMAGLKWLVKKFGIKTRSLLELEAEAQRYLGPGSLPPPEEGTRCETRNNSGRILERVDGGRPRMTDQYCDCRMGKDLKSAERRVRSGRQRNS